ncbi:hypothetical protein ACFL1X_06305, partial [Candidatus Hydrogenedentota bacterium]
SEMVVGDSPGYIDTGAEFDDMRAGGKIQDPPLIPFSANVTSLISGQGKYTFTILGRDRAGNLSGEGGNDKNSITVYWDKMPPETGLTSFPDPTVFSESISFTFEASDELSPVHLCKFWSQLWEIARNGAGLWEKVDPANPVAQRSDYQLTPSDTFDEIKSGRSYLFEVRAVDAAGNYEIDLNMPQEDKDDFADQSDFSSLTSRPYNVFVWDASNLSLVPDTILTNTPQAVTEERWADFEWTLRPNTFIPKIKFEYVLYRYDNGGWKELPRGANYTEDRTVRFVKLVPNCQYKFEVWAYSDDNGDNRWDGDETRDETPATYTWTVYDPYIDDPPGSPDPDDPDDPDDDPYPRDPDDPPLPEPPDDWDPDDPDPVDPNDPSDPIPRTPIPGLPDLGAYESSSDIGGDYFNPPYAQPGEQPVLHWQSVTD